MRRFRINRIFATGLRAAPHFDVTPSEAIIIFRCFSPQSRAPRNSLIRLIRCYAVRGHYYISLFFAPIMRPTKFVNSCNSLLRRPRPTIIFRCMQRPNHEIRCLSAPHNRRAAILPDSIRQRDYHARHTGVDSLQAVFEFRDHAARHRTIGFQRLEGRAVDFGDDVA